MIALIFLGDDMEVLMSIVLDHTIVPARDKEESARFFARIFGLEYKGPVSHFAPVRINETLTIDFDNWDSFERHHYAFKVSETEFDGIFDRVRGELLAVLRPPLPRAVLRFDLIHADTAAELALVSSGITTPLSRAIFSANSICAGLAALEPSSPEVSTSALLGACWSRNTRQIAPDFV